MMLVMDPPQHDRFKLLVSRGFTPKAAQSLRGRIEELAREIIDDVIERGECDFVARHLRSPALGADRRADGHPARRRRAAVRADRADAHDRRRGRLARAAPSGDVRDAQLRRRDGGPQAGRPRRRHRLAAGAGRGRRRAAHRRRAAVVLLAARERRRRHHPQPARRRACSSCSITPTSGPGCRATSTACWPRASRRCCATRRRWCTSGARRPRTPWSATSRSRPATS